MSTLDSPQAPDSGCRDRDDHAPAPRTFSLASLMFAMTLLAVWFAGFAADVEHGTMLFVASLPALFILRYQTIAARRHGLLVSTAVKITVFLLNYASLLLVLEALWHLM